MAHTSFPSLSSLRNRVRPPKANSLSSGNTSRLVKTTTPSPAPPSTVLNERDCLADILTTEKNLVQTYAYAATETSSASLSQAILYLLQEAQQAQQQIFQLMRKQGMISFEEAPVPHIRKSLQRWDSLRKEFPYT